MRFEKTFPLGTVFDPTNLGRTPLSPAESVVLSLSDLQVHALIAGSSGSGKSRAATALALDAFEQNVPTIVIDKHGDTVEDIAAHVAARAMKRDPQSMADLLRRLHYL